MHLNYDSAYWQNILGPNASAMPMEDKLHMMFSLMIFLRLSLAKVLEFIFTSKICEVRSRTSRFMGYTLSALTEDFKFPPGMIFRAWLENFPESRKYMQDMIKPVVQDIVEAESNKIINDPAIKIKMKTLTLKDIRGLLDPKKIMDRYKEKAPFTWMILHTFASLSNKSRKQKKRSKMPTTIDDDWDELFP